MKTYLEYLQTIDEELLQESYINLIGTDAKTLEQKNAVKKEVFDLLQAAYAPIQGIKGSGFKSEDDMVANIWFWKLCRKNGKIIAVIMYKDRDGRKMVALGTDGSSEGKAAARKMMVEEISRSRSYGEASGPALGMVKKLFGMQNKDPIEGSPLEKYTVPADQVEAILKKPVQPVSKYEYIRGIGGTDQKKVMFGRMYKK